MEQTFFSESESESETDYPSVLLFDMETKFDYIINSIDKLLLNNNVIHKDSLKDIKVQCEMHMNCVKQINRLEMIQNCKHKYITDMVDIHVEKSQIITYCIFCESMKPSEGNK